MKINAVEFINVESCYNLSISKYEKSNSNIKIFKISQLPFDIFYFFLMMTLCQMQQQSTSFLKQLVVQNCANGLTI